MPTRTDQEESALHIDPSQLMRPEVKFAKKDLKAFRDYTVDLNDPIKERVRKTYHDMHTHQTVEYVKGQVEKWCKFDHFKATIRETMEKLNTFIDESDPDVDFPNVIHGFQTAERIRADYPDLDWFQLTGFIHDLGKVLGMYGEPQWATTGDTFVVGCQPSPNIVYRETSFKNYPDAKDPRYNTKYGMYEPNCGLDNVMMSWGHDEYLYRVLKHNRCSLPEVALKMIRYHSFYPWHTSNDYTHLTNNEDEETKKWVLVLNQYDLYTKSNEMPDVEKLWPYYQKLIDKYCPGVLEW